MQLKELQVKDFRNYHELSLSFPNSLNIFLGENAQGKTNLLEAIYVLAMSKSHRTNQEKELIAFDEEFAKLSGQLQKKNTLLPLEIIISKKGRKTKINHLEQKKLSNYVGQMNVILFAPEDLSLVKGSPSIRRRFMDMELGQMSPRYLYELVKYNQILKQRNTYLKQTTPKQNHDDLYLDVLTQQLVESGSRVVIHRLEFLKKLEIWSKKIHHEISHGKEDLALLYLSSVPFSKEATVEEIRQSFEKELAKRKDQELFRKTTLIGPHRDDLTFLINGKDVQSFGSQGQQRTTALSVKLAEIDLIHEKIGEYPILLLDDVMSELDDERQLHLLESIEGKVQTFLTTTTLAHLKQNLRVTPDIFYVTQGKIERQGETL